jgi:hypothetical protein
MIALLSGVGFQPQKHGLPRPSGEIGLDRLPAVCGKVPLGDHRTLTVQFFDRHPARNPVTGEAPVAFADLGGKYYRLTNTEVLQMPAAMNPAGGQVAAPAVKRPSEVTPLRTKVAKPEMVYTVGARKFSAVNF